jgi:hypothetical protein
MSNMNRIEPIFMFGCSAATKFCTFRKLWVIDAAGMIWGTGGGRGGGPVLDDKNSRALPNQPLVE